MTKDEIKQRELYIIEQLRKGHSRKWVCARLEEDWNIAPSTAVNCVNKIGGQLNKGLEKLSEDAAQYIYNTLLSTIDDTLEDNDRKNRLQALRLLADITGCNKSDQKTEVNVNLGFDWGNE